MAVPGIDLQVIKPSSWQYRAPMRVQWKPNGSSVSYADIDSTRQASMVDPGTACFQPHGTTPGLRLRQRTVKVPMGGMAYC
eukprot:4263173-Lingulodinium_polyedra.AAC.1